jgi:ABC-type polysaccharide/polyol phosphate export permease
MCVAALARNFNDLSNTQFYVVFPCFLPSGVLSLDVLPEWTQALAWLLPRTPVVDLARAELLGVAAAPRAPWLLAAWTGLSVLIASRAMIRRLFK